jgi:hypothetical protein
MGEFDFVYKEYTPEESKIYEQAIKEILQNIKNGQSFKEATNNVSVEDAELKALIEDDALKILIAELCYVSKIPFEELADMLQLPVEKIQIANFEMLEDMQLTLNQTFKNQRGGNA